MPWYIRFAKIPEIQLHPPHNLTLSFEIRNDLGETLYPGPCAITATLFKRLPGPDPTGTHVVTHSETWTGTSWTTPVTFRLAPSLLKSGTQVCVKLDCPPQTPDSASLSSRPIAIEGCADLSYIHGTTSSWVRAVPGAKSEPFALRRLPGGLQVWEGTGSSIAAHVWDAGMVLCGHLVSLGPSGQSRHRIENELGSLLEGAKPGQLRVLELGAGCGISSFLLAQQFGARISRLEITDREEAMELVERNLRLVREEGLAQPGNLEGCGAFALDWDSERDRKAAAEGEERDLILVSDCTYNVDAVESLVKALKAMADTTKTLIAVALKRRHEDEVKFFHEMEANGFVHIRKYVFSMAASEVEEKFGVEPSDIELHLYRKGLS